MIFLTAVILCSAILNSSAQKVRWPYSLNESSYGAGVPAGLRGESPELYPGIESAVSDKEGNRYYHYRFMPFDARQLAIMEMAGPVAILKIEIGNGDEDRRELPKALVDTVETRPIDDELSIRNIHFPPMESITDVWLYMDLAGTDAQARLAGIALTDFRADYTPGINLPEKQPFEDNLMDMDEDAGPRMLVGDYLSPLAPIVSVDNRYIYFTSMIKDPEKALWDPNTTVEEGIEKTFRATLGTDGRISLVELSNFNLDDKVSSTSSLVSVSQDNNVMYMNTMDIDDALPIYRVSMTKDKDGYAEYHLEKIKSGKYENQSEYANEIMSYDEEYLIVTMWREEEPLDMFERDLYVARKIKENRYGEFVRMGDDINSIGAEVPCFLAADNRTLFFASDGHIGYGQKDIYVSRRLDDTWQNWSRPLNLGPVINTEGTENYFTVDTKGEYAYVVKWDTDKEGFSDLFRVGILPPGEEEPEEQTVKPEPVAVIQGMVLNSKTRAPVRAKIRYVDIHSKEPVGEAVSNAVSGEYTIALPAGRLYSYEAEAEDYLSESNSIDTRELEETESVNRDLMLVPIEVGEVIRLNNIFFETDKAILRKESDLELEKLLGILITNAKMRIEIAGHTDNVGSSEYNLELSQKRADAVQQWLVEKGIEKEKIVSKGYGESKPVTSNNTEMGRQLNRRVEFKILKQ